MRCLDDTTVLLLFNIADLDNLVINLLSGLLLNLILLIGQILLVFLRCACTFRLEKIDIHSTLLVSLLIVLQFWDIYIKKQVIN